MSKRKTSLLVGILAGTILALLFAPEKGKHLRRKIKNERKEGGFGCRAVKNHFLDMFREIAQSVQEKVSGNEDFQAALEMGRDKILEIAAEKKKHLNQMLDDARQKYEEIRDLVVEEGEKTAKTARKTVRKAKSTVRKAQKGVTQVKRGVRKAKSAARKATTQAKKIHRTLKAKKKAASDLVDEIKENLK